MFVPLAPAAKNFGVGLWRQLGRQGRSRARRIGGGFRGGPRSGDSFRGGGNFRGGGLRDGSLSRLGGSVRAGRQDKRAVDRAGLRHSEPLSCEPALAKAPPGFGLLSERCSEGAADKRFELSSQALGLFQVCRGCGFGGFHCRLGRRRLDALLNELWCSPAKSDSRKFLIEWFVLLLCVMAMASLESFSGRGTYHPRVDARPFPSSKARSGQPRSQRAFTHAKRALGSQVNGNQRV
jgi:hypothetical protein